MFDTMTLTKAAAGFCGAFLVFLMGNWAAESLYHVGESGHGGEHAQGYTIEVASDEVADDEPEVEIDFLALVAAADAGAGERVYAKCKACHKEPGAGGTGPTLHGVVGRDIASVADFSGYTDALMELDGNWEPDALNAFLSDPKGYAPGTKMNLAVKKIGERADLIAYLETLPN